MTTDPARPFGRVVTAMVTPLTEDGSIDLAGAQELAAHLVDRGGSDGLVVFGTTGESPTITDAEQRAVLEVVLDAVGDRATVIAGVGTNDTAHSIEKARDAERLGAHALMAVTPYYNKPPRIVAVKDPKGDLGAVAWTLTRTDLAYYSGEDMLNLPLLALGAVGVVSVVGHLVGPRLAELVTAVESGDLVKARPPLPSGGLRVVALGGLGEIGRNMAVLEYEGRLLVIDCGVLFPEAEQPGVDLILPDFGVIEHRLHDVEAVVL